MKASGVMEQFQDMIARLYPEENKTAKEITFQITDMCNLQCTYCYQHNKGKNIMDFETAKKFIDILLADQNTYINTNNTNGVIIEFIGGEPLLAVDLMDKITEYFLEQMILLNHPWLTKFRFSICSNGVLYFSEKFQNYLKKYSKFVSFSISVDGNKELHDACRVFPDGSGSYDMAIEATKHYVKNYSANESIGSKMTLSPNNIKYTFEAIKNLIELKYSVIYANCVYEEGWELHHATEFYYQLKKLSDYLLTLGDLEDKLYISLFEEFFFMPDIDDTNWCGGNGRMLAVDWRGQFYPCVRYMDSSLGTKVKPIILGNTFDGLVTKEEEKKWVEELQAMTRTSQSPQKCLDCQISRGCSWCSAYNYEYYGKLNKRTTFICDMHKARALANVYFWNKYYKVLGEDTKKLCYLSKEEAIKIIPEEEYEMLIELTKN